VMERAEPGLTPLLCTSSILRFLLQIEISKDVTKTV
jgi:hypothetical protein